MGVRQAVAVKFLKMNMGGAVAIALAVFGPASGASASPVDLPATEFQKSVTPGGDPQVNTTGAESLQRTYDDPSGQHVVTTATSPFGVTATVTVSVPNLGQVPGPGGIARSNELYYFEIVGPSGNVPIVISNATGSSSFSLLGNSFALFGNPLPTDMTADLTIGTDAADIVSGCVGGSNATCAAHTSFDVSGTYSVPTNVPVSVFLSVVVNSRGYGTFSASVDPNIAIDPTFADIGQYSLLFSEGIPVEASATPLPGSLPMFGSVLALGGIGWRRFAKKATSRV